MEPRIFSVSVRCSFRSSLDDVVVAGDEDVEHSRAGGDRRGAELARAAGDQGRHGRRALERMLMLDVHAPALGVAQDNM